jgi:hypothetical protein
LKRGLKYVGRCGYRTIYVNLDIYEKALDAAWKTGKIPKRFSVEGVNTGLRLH